MKSFRIQTYTKLEPTNCYYQIEKLLDINKFSKSNTN